MALSRVKTWIAAETLTASDLNAEFNNILNNAISLISPTTAALDLNGKELILDADADTSITSDTDDQIDVKIGGSDDFKFTANLFDVLSGSTMNVNAGATHKVAGVATWTQGADVASATDALIGIDGNMFDITGTTTIATLATKGVGTAVILQFDDALTLTHDSANLILPGAANITTAAGDIGLFYEYASADWRCVAYTKASGKPVIATDLSEDTTPQLGGDLDLNGKNIDFPTTANISDCLDEDLMTSDSATMLATQQSIKAYVDVHSPRGYIDGYIISNNSGDAAKDLDIAAGSCRDDGDAVTIIQAATIVKQLDAVWAVGTNAGALDGTESSAGTPDGDTWYHIWAIRRSDTGVTDVLASESATAPTMPTNYDQKRRIGAVLFDATPDIIPFNQVDDDFYWDEVVQDKSLGAIAATRVLLTLTVPTGILVDAHMLLYGHRPSAAGYLLVQDPQQTDVAPSSTIYHLYSVNTHPMIEVYRQTDTSGRVAHRADVATVQLAVNTIGWRDPRGKNG